VRVAAIDGGPAPVRSAPPGAPTAWAVMARTRGENFPVASHVLPRRVRHHLLAIYGFARLADQLGDEFPGDRLAALDWLEGELDRAFAGRAAHPLLCNLQPTLRAYRLPREPFAALIEANRLDQRVRRYRTWEQLLGYCELSANPVGELVLGVLGSATPERVALASSICTALQLAEHWQDVAEDAGRGRVYLPAEDLARFGCEERDLHAAHAGERLRRLLALEVGRTHELLDRGAPLARTLRGRARVAVAAFVGGGRAALQAIERAGYDVLAGPPRAGRAQRARALLGALGDRRA
jgi:squalene synthase HpnC